MIKMEVTKQTNKKHKKLPSYARTIVAVAILMTTFIVFFPSLQNRMLKTWDDQDYITNNELVKSLAVDNMVKIFKEDKGLYGNYHPLTTLSLAINYHFSKESPFGYHLTNLLLHLLNVLLVFIFIYNLSEKKLEVAAVTALLFGLTPIHVESVAWISERKDVLYAFFFLASLISYQQFMKKSDWKLYAVCLFLFLCSLMSKAMAASLPLVLILMGFMANKRWSWKLLPDKIPFFILAILFGLYAIKIQAEGDAIGEMLPLMMRTTHACYGFAAYIPKIFFPTALSAFYPYPYPYINAQWITSPTPVFFYLTLLLTIAIFSFSIFCVTSNRKNLHVVGFGILFYAATIAMVLQFFPVGRAIMADRYAYIPSIGLFFIVGYFLSLLFRESACKIPVILFVTGYAGFLFYLTFVQTRVWQNDETLWSNVIHNNPFDSRIALAYTNRAQFYLLEGMPKEALNDLLILAEWTPKDDEVLEKIGKIYGRDFNDLETSIIYFQKAYLSNPRNVEVLKDLATVYGIKGDLKKSLEYSLIGLKINKNDAFLLYNTGTTYKNLGQEALGREYIKKAKQNDPTLPDS